MLNVSVYKMPNIIDLSIKNSNSLKGFALLLLLCHHLFYNVNDDYCDIYIGHGQYLFHSIAMQSKLCVAIFVFLSGYGLMRQVNGGILNLRSFYQRRMTKLMMNYWLIWLLFVPMGILFFDRTFAIVYGEEFLVLKFAADILGISNAFGFFGYNATWWFYSVIIILYLLFPLLYKYRRYWVLQIIIGIVVYYLLPWRGIGMYLLHFCTGMAVANNKITPPVIGINYGLRWRFSHSSLR